MVLGVCRRMLRGVHDCEDVFQATFLVLWCRERLANWLDARRARKLAESDVRAVLAMLKQKPDSEIQTPAGGRLAVNATGRGNPNDQCPFRCSIPINFRSVASSHTGSLGHDVSPGVHHLGVASFPAFQPLEEIQNQGFECLGHWI